MSLNFGLHVTVTLPIVRPEAPRVHRTRPPAYLAWEPDRTSLEPPASARKQGREGWAFVRHTLVPKWPPVAHVINPPQPTHRRMLFVTITPLRSVHSHKRREEPPARSQQDSNDDESEQYFYRKLLSEVR